MNLVVSQRTEEGNKVRVMSFVKILPIIKLTTFNGGITG